MLLPPKKNGEAITYSVDQFVRFAHAESNDCNDDHTHPKDAKDGQPKTVRTSTVHFNVWHSLILLW